MQFWLGTAFVETAEQIELARVADECGIHTIAPSDHIFYTDYSTPYPYGELQWDETTHWPDVWVTIGAMAAVTSRVRFSPNVYVAPARDLFTVAKSVSTAAVLSGGRVTFGVGAGWCKDEFVQTGQDFHTRGRRLDEMIPVLRDLWTGETVEYHGEFHDFGPLSISPAPAQAVPVYIGGDSDAALRRAARIGDGWIGNRIYREEQLDRVLARLKELLKEYGRPEDDLDVVAPIAVWPEAGAYERFEDKGVTGTMCAPWWLATEEDRRKYGNSLKISMLERFAEEVMARMET